MSKFMQFWRSIFGRETPLSSQVCRSIDFESAWYRHWAKKIAQQHPDINRFGEEFAKTFKQVWQAMSFTDLGVPQYRHRKMWEWCAIIQALSERHCLKPGKRGCGFAVGHEPLASFFASLGTEILATDLVVESETGWNATGQQVADASQLWWPNLITESEFQNKVRFQSVDMRDLSGLPRSTFDFCWSSCSLEHLGDLEKGLQFVEESLDLLAPGGVAAHTTEFNVSSKEETLSSGWAVIYREKDLLPLAERVARRGGRLVPLQFDPGTDRPDIEYDVQPYYSTGKQHVKLQFEGYVMTSILLLVEKM